MFRPKAAVMEDNSAVDNTVKEFVLTGTTWKQRPEEVLHRQLSEEMATIPFARFVAHHWVFLGGV